MTSRDRTRSESAPDLFQRIRDHRESMSRSRLKVADYLLENYEDAAFLPAARIAAALGVSESLVVRFASSLGYSGYPEMTRELQELVKRRLSLAERLGRRPVRLGADTPAEEVLRVVTALDRQNLEETLHDASSSSLERVVDALLGAETIFLLGLRGSAHLAALFGVLLDKAGADVRVVTSGDVVLFDRLRHIGQRDLLFAISFARYTRRSVDALRVARGRGATTVVLTDSLLAPPVAEADLSLHTKVASYAFQNSYVAAVGMMNALVVAWTLRAEERTLRSLRELEELLPHEEFI